MLDHSTGHPTSPPIVEDQTPMAPMKRRRPPSVQPSGLVCCEHGHSCHRGGDRDDWVDKVAESVGCHLMRDTSENGFVGRIAKAVYVSLRGMFKSKMSSQQWSR